MGRQAKTATKRKAVIQTKPKKAKSAKVMKEDPALQLTLEERLNSNNGKFIDPDSMITLFSKIAFSAGEIALLRRTCVWWNHVLSSNAMWKMLFQRDFAPSSSRLVQSKI